MNEVQQAIESWIKDTVRDAVEECFRECFPALIEEYFKNVNDPLRRYYTKEQVCEKLSICHATYHNWINSGKITERKIKGRVYVDARDIEKALMEGTIRKGSRKPVKETTNDN